MSSTQPANTHIRSCLRAVSHHPVRDRLKDSDSAICNLEGRAIYFQFPILFHARDFFYSDIAGGGRFSARSQKKNRAHGIFDPGTALGSCAQQRAESGSETFLRQKDGTV